MKTSIIFCNTLKNLGTTEQTCKRLRKIGFDGLDYSVLQEWKTPLPIFSESRSKWVDYFTEQRKIIEGEGLKVFQTHATFPSDFDENNKYVFTPAVLEQLKREIEATAILGSKYIVIHPINTTYFPLGKPIDQEAKKRDLEINIREFSKLKDTLLEFGVKNGVEDMFAGDPNTDKFVQTGCSTPEDMVKYIDGLNDRNAFCACLDTGHVKIHGVTPAHAVRTLGDRLELLHVHDNLGYSDYHLIPGFGWTDWEDFAKALKEVNYKGVMSLELSYYQLLNKFGPDFIWKYNELAFESVKYLCDLVEKS